jgi:ElaB/YqjD/DUF883 family membrane-anchored ribosome-binding protein
MNKNIADEAINSASQTMSDLNDAAKDYAGQAMDKAMMAKNRAEASIRRAADVATHYVSEQPVRSVCIAAGIGAAVALLAYSMCGSKNRC